MRYESVDTIVDDVKVCFDEIGLNDANFIAGADDADMATIIESKIGDALRFVNLHADVGYLEPTVVTEKDIEKKDMTVVNGVVYCVLPKDFLRMVYAKLDDWLFAVTEPIYYTDKEYATLKNPITTGYPDNPKVAITADKHLELYTTKSSEVSLTFGYIGETVQISEGENKGKWPIPNKLYRAVIYYIAGLTLLTYKDAHADALLNMAITIMGAKTNSNS